MTGKLLLGGREVPYVVRSSPRARRLLLRIRDVERVEVIVPRRCVLPDVEQVLREKAAWIIRTFDRLSLLHRQDAVRLLEPGRRLSLMGEERTLRIVREERRRPAVALSSGEIVVRLPSAGDADMRGVLERWYKARAAVLIPRRVEELNARWRFEFAKISVRNQRTRWGSCSRKGTLSFNWRLVILPPQVADYLICHELAHLRHMNHSSRFWGLVAKLFPPYREAEGWLRRNGRSVRL